MIQGNLALARIRRRQGGDLSLSVIRVGNNSGGKGGEREELLAERGRLIGELHSILAKIERVRGVVEQHNKDRGELARSKEERSKDVKERQQRTVLLGLYVKQVTNMISKLEGLAKKLERVAERVDEKEVRGERMFSSGVGVETESGKNVRETVQMGVEHMKTALVEGVAKERRGMVRGNILQLVGDMPASVIANCLVEQTVDLTHQVKKKIESVDLVRDASVLQKQEGEKDNEFLSSVRREVAQFYKRHVTSQVAATNLATSIVTWEERADMMREKLGGKGEVGREEEESARLKGMVSSYRSSLDSVRSSLEGMEMSANRHPLVDTVRIQQEQIEQLGQVISVLISSSSIAPMKTHQSTTLGTMTTSLPVLASQISTSSLLMTDGPSNHLTILGTGPTSSLASTMVGGTACSTLTPSSQLLIHRKRSSLPQLGGGGSEREDTVGRIVKLLEEVERKERELAHCKLGKVSSVDREELDRLERSLASSIREQGRNLGPVIEESVGMRTEAGRISERVGELHSEWIRQPGGEVAVGGSFVWGEVEGRGWVSKIEIQDNVQDPIPVGTFPLSLGWMKENWSSSHPLDVMVNCLFDKVARQTVDSLKVYCLNSIKLVETGNQNSQTRLGNHYSKSRKSELS